MTIDATIERIGAVGLVPVVRATSADDARRAVDAIRAGGIPIVEIAMTVPGAARMIQELVLDSGPDVLTGAGTVVNGDQASACMDAGAQFLVSPGLSIDVLDEAVARDILAIPGALTPTEIMFAWAEGAQLIKLFPCGTVGGPAYLQALRAPFPDVAFMPTGGIGREHVAGYIAAGAFALGVGSSVVDPRALRYHEPERITAAARSMVEALHHARAARPVGPRESRPTESGK